MRLLGDELPLLALFRIALLPRTYPAPAAPDFVKASDNLPSTSSNARLTPSQIAWWSHSDSAA